MRQRTAGEAPNGLFLEQPSPLSFAKAIKNEAELAGMREAHLRDAVALAETLHHLEQEAGPSSTHSSHTHLRYCQTRGVWTGSTDAAVCSAVHWAT